MVRSGYDGLKTLFAVPREAFDALLFPVDQLGSHDSTHDVGYLIAHCRDFSVLYDVMPQSMREALQRDAGLIAERCDVPRGLAESLVRQVGGQTELALWKTGAQLLSRDVDYDELPIEDCKKYPSIFMPRWASRITLEVTDVRVEQVQEITNADAMAEGVGHLYGYEKDDPAVDGRIRFAELWDSINAMRGFNWGTNPWVWVVTFRKTED